MSTLAVRRGGGSDGTFRSIHSHGYSSRSYALTWMIILCLLACSIRMATHREARALNPRRAVRSRSQGLGTAGRRRAACTCKYGRRSQHIVPSPAIPLRPQQQRHADARAFHRSVSYVTHAAAPARAPARRPGRAGRLFIAPSPTTLSRTSGPDIVVPNEPS